MDNDQIIDPFAFDDDLHFNNKEFENNSIPERINQINLGKKIVQDLKEELFNRIKTENEVRKLKRANNKCSFDVEGICCNTSIRCGERQQYATPEDLPEKNFPHRCNHHTSVTRQNFNILIVDDDPLVRELCAELFKAMGIKKENMDFATNVKEGEERLKISKIRNKPFHLALIDLRMQGPSGYYLVNYMVERNFNTRILIISGYAEISDKPANYMGSAEIIPGNFVVKSFLKKPIPYSELFKHIVEIEIEMKQ